MIAFWNFYGDGLKTVFFISFHLCSIESQSNKLNKQNIRQKKKWWDISNIDSGIDLWEMLKLKQRWNWVLVRPPPKQHSQIPTFLFWYGGNPWASLSSSLARGWAVCCGHTIFVRLGWHVLTGRRSPWLTPPLPPPSRFLPDQCLLDAERAPEIGWKGENVGQEVLVQTRASWNSTNVEVFSTGCVRAPPGCEQAHI